MQTVQQANEAIGQVLSRHRPVAGACMESLELALQLAESGFESDQMRLAEVIGFGVASLGLLTRSLCLAVLDLECAAAALQRAVGSGGDQADQVSVVPSQ